MEYLGLLGASHSAIGHPERSEGSEAANLGLFAARLAQHPQRAPSKRRPYTVIVSSVVGEGIGVPQKNCVATRP